MVAQHRTGNARTDTGARSAASHRALVSRQEILHNRKRKKAAHKVAVGLLNCCGCVGLKVLRRVREQEDDMVQMTVLFKTLQTTSVFVVDFAFFVVFLCSTGRVDTQRS
jgi:hypothetical protein